MHVLFSMESLRFSFIGQFSKAHLTRVFLLKETHPQALLGTFLRISPKLAFFTSLYWGLTLKKAFCFSKKEKQMSSLQSQKVWWVLGIYRRWSHLTFKVICSVTNAHACMCEHTRSITEVKNESILNLIKTTIRKRRQKHCMLTGSSSPY